MKEGWERKRRVGLDCRKWRGFVGKMKMELLLMQIASSYPYFPPVCIPMGREKSIRCI